VDADGDAVDDGNWLHRLAQDAFPDDDLVGDLLRLARDGGLEVDEMFVDQALDFVLNEYANEADLGIGMYESYVDGINMLSAYQRPATAAQFFGINVKEADYGTYDGEDWIPDKAARQAEIDRLCAEPFIAFVGYWRANFFDLLISGKQPEPRDR
jgi:hypothetical protein